jgi:hypothetical protein
LIIVDNYLHISTSSQTRSDPFPKTSNDGASMSTLELFHIFH